MRALPAPMPLACIPQPDETYRSWLDRTAERNRVPLGRVLESLHVDDPKNPGQAPAGFGVTLTDHQIACLVAGTGIPAADIRATLLTSLAGRTVPTDQATSRFAWLYTNGSHFCPECLSNDGYWKLRHRVPAFIACTTHRTLLYGHCLHCERRAGGYKADGSTSPVFNLAKPPVTGLCGNSVPTPAGKTRSPNRRCDEDLRLFPTVPVTDEILAAQTVIDDVYDQGHGILLGQPATSADWFTAVRGVTAACCQSLTVDDLPDNTPPSIGDAFTGFLTERDERSARRRRALAAGKQRAVPRQRFMTDTLDDPTVLAAIIPLAVQIASTPVDEPSDLVDLLAHRYKNGSATNPAGALRSYRVPEPLITRLLRTSRLLARVDIPRGHTNGPLTPDHVPELFWEPDWNDTLRKHFNRPDWAINDETGRRYASLVAVRHLTGSTWRAALDHFGRRNQKTDRATAALNAAGTTDAFISDVIAALNSRSAGPLYDYTAARTRHAQFLINDDDWTEIVDRSGTSQGRRGGRDCANAYVWAHLTGSPIGNAPIWGPHGLHGTSRETYHQWTRTRLPKNQEALDAYKDAITTGDRSRLDALTPPADMLPSPSLADLRPDIVRDWHPTANRHLRPEWVTPTSNRIVWWQCETCGTEYQATIASRSRRASQGCGRQCLKAG